MEFVLDTNVFLNVKSREEPYYSYSKGVLDSVDEGDNLAILSTVVLTEICCSYYQTRETRGKEDFLLHVLSSQNYKVMDVSVGIADEAARICSETGLKLPDAIIAATGIIGEADYIVTNDLNSFKRVAKIIVVRSPKDIMSEISRK